MLSDVDLSSVDVLFGYSFELLNTSTDNCGVISLRRKGDRQIPLTKEHVSLATIAAMHLRSPKGPYHKVDYFRYRLGLGCRAAGGSLGLGSCSITLSGGADPVHASGEGWRGRLGGKG